MQNQGLPGSDPKDILKRRRSHRCQRSTFYRLSSGAGRGRGGPRPPGRAPAVGAYGAYANLRYKGRIRKGPKVNAAASSVPAAEARPGPGAAGGRTVAGPGPEPH